MINTTYPIAGGGMKCSCGASCPKYGIKRFLRRHPKMCSERREFAKKLAQGTRHLDDLETNRDQ